MGQQRIFMKLFDHRIRCISGKRRTDILSKPLMANVRDGGWCILHFLSSSELSDTCCPRIASGSTCYTNCRGRTLLDRCSKGDSPPFMRGSGTYMDFMDHIRCSTIDEYRYFLRMGFSL